MAENVENKKTVEKSKVEEPENKEPENKEPKKTTIPNDEKRRLYADAVKGFKNSEEFQEMLQQARQAGEERAKMSAEQKAEADRQEREEKEKDERKAFEREKAEFYTKQSLQERGLPISLSDHLAGVDDAVLDDIKKIINEAVKKGVLDKMAGKETPAADVNVPTAVNKDEFFAKTYSEQVQLLKDNPQLATQLGILYKE